MKVQMKSITTLSLFAMLLFTTAFGQTKISKTMNTEKEHYTFQLSEKVSRQKVTFKSSSLLEF